MPNRLSTQSSPYLLQHAHNPVDWFPWGPEAFAEARRRNVPIFLSIGYSTCYWCHVMERESFESEAIARLMNDKFVCVKVDREERPDVDELYMAATQIMTGRGGWPMSCFLEPDNLRPYWCGTYFPPEPRHGMPSFPQVLEGMSGAWTSRRDDAINQAKQVADAVAEHLAQQQAPAAIGLEQVSEAARSLLKNLDRIHGGFGSAPKFPQPVFLELLLDVRDSAGDDATRSALDAAIRLTLDHMATGGIFDHVGGGFHRYSVDAHWLVPHFEKMLYDNAQLASLYARAATTYNDNFYRRTARRTLDYVLREMTSPEGAFFSAQDAEVDGREGANYVWRPDELRAALDASDADFALKIYNLNAGPNFRDPHAPDAPPANVLFLSDRPEKLAEQLKLSLAEFDARLDTINTHLYAARAHRPQPRLDDKILTAWNGLMIAAFTRAGADLNEPRYTAAAARAADFILAHHLSPSRDLLRSSRNGQPGPSAVLEDYAYLIHGLLALRDPRATEIGPPISVPSYLNHARTLASRASSLFSSSDGSFFDTRADQTDLFVRARTSHDGATPSGASVMLNALLSLHEQTNDPAFLKSALGLIRSLSAAIAGGPTLTANSTRALLRLLTAGDAVTSQLAAFGPAPSTEAAPPETTPVEIYASEERIQIGKDHPAELTLSLRIAPGYHITAADPGPGGGGGQGLIPLRVHIINGAGLAAYADYPAGDPYGPTQDLRIYTNQLDLTVAIERTGDWSGRPLLAVTYQACTDTECLTPTTAELDIAIDRLD